MSDRGVFVTAFLTMVLIVAGAFALPDLFFYELLKSTVFVVIVVMVFFGDDKFPYMLGMIAPVLWFLVSFMTGSLVWDISTLGRFLAGKPVGPLATPLHGFSILSGLAVLICSARAWRKEVTEKFLGKSFAMALVVALVWAVVVGVYWFHKSSSGIPAH